MKTTVSEKGQVTIPKPLRDSLGLRPGHVIDFTEERGRLVGRKVVQPDDIESVVGILKLDKSTDEIMIELRGEPDAV